MTPDCPLVGRIVEAKHWRPLTPRYFAGAIIHLTVNPPTTPALAIAHDFATTDIEKSSHVIAGPDGAIQCVPESGAAWAAAGTNFTHFQLEIVATPSMTWGDWVAAPQTRLAAAILADVAARHLFPCVMADDVDAFMNDPRGLATHWHVTQAVKRAHALKLTSSQFFTTERGHFDPFASPHGPDPAIDQFDPVAFLGMVLEQLPSDYASKLNG